MSEPNDAGRQYTREIHEDWWNAKAVIEKFLVDVHPAFAQDPKGLDHNSSALLARLSHADLVVCRHSHMKGE